MSPEIEQQIRDKAEEKYPRANINNCKSDLEYHMLVGLTEAGRSAYIIAAREFYSLGVQAGREDKENCDHFYHSGYSDGKMWNPDSLQNHFGDETYFNRFPKVEVKDTTL